MGETGWLEQRETKQGSQKRDGEDKSAENLTDIYTCLSLKPVYANTVDEFAEEVKGKL